MSVHYDRVLQGQVKKALKSLADVSTLGRSPLAGCQIVIQRVRGTAYPPEPEDFGRVLRDILSEAIDQLRPRGPYSPLAAVWRPYNILDLAYRQGTSIHTIYNQILCISKSQFYREREEAIEALTRFFRDEEVGLAGQVTPNVGDLVPLPRLRDFVGRQQELAEYRRRLETEPVVVITGLPGIGKTALGAELVASLPQCRWLWLRFLPGEADNVDFVLQKVASLLAQDGRSELARILALEGLTRERRPWEEKFGLLIQGLEAVLPGTQAGAGCYLLCLDNFHVVDEDPEINALCARLRSDLKHSRLLVISRRVPRFAYDLAIAPLAGLEANDARALLDRAGMGPLSQDTFQRLYAKTQGHPKFLDLLVTWMKNLGLNTLLSREAFVERLVADTLKVSSLQNYLLQNVYETLEEKERLFTTVVSACRQRFDERDEDIEEILAEMGIERVGDVVAGLVNKNLLTHLHQEGEMLLHPIIREYFYRQAGLGERRWIHSKLAGYYAAHAEYLEAAYHHCRAGNWSPGVALIADNLEVLINSGQAQAALQQLARLDARRLSPADWGQVCQARGDLYGMAGRYVEAVASYQEVLALVPGALNTAELQRKIGVTWEKRGDHQRAMEHLQTGQQALAAAEGWPARLERVRIAEQMAFVQRRQGMYPQAIALANQALAWLDGLVADSPDLGPLVRKERAALDDALGVSYFYQGDYPQAIEYWQKSLAIRRDLADAYGIALSGHNLGLVYTRQGDFASAIRYCQESLQIRERIGDVWGSGTSYNSLGILHYNLGAYPQALECYQKSLAILETIGEAIGVATCYNNLGEVYWRQGFYAQAQEYCRKSLAMRQKIGDAYGLASTYTNLGSIASSQGHYAQALAYQRQALTIKEGIGDNWGLVVSYNELGRVYASQGDPQAGEYYHKGFKLAEEIGYALGVAHLYRSLGEMYYRQGDYLQARRYLQQVLERCRAMGHKDVLSQAQALLGEVHLAGGEPEEALAYAQESWQLAAEMGSQEGQGVAYRVLGQAWAGLGRGAEAEEAFRRSLEILERVGNPLQTGEAWRSYGAFLVAQGQNERGRSYLRKALAIFAEIGATGELGVRG